MKTTPGLEESWSSEVDTCTARNTAIIINVHQNGHVECAVDVPQVFANSGGVMKNLRRIGEHGNICATNVGLDLRRD